MIPPLYILLPILFLGSIVSTIAGGGLGILLTIASLFFTDVRTSVVLVSILGFVIQAMKILHFRRFARWSIVGWYLLLGIPMSFAGAWMFFVVPERTLEIALAIICIAFCISELSPGRMRVQPSKMSLMGLGAINGLLGGMVGNGALMRSSALLAFGLSKEEFIGTSAVIALWMNVGKTSVYLTQFEWSQEMVILILASIPLVYAGIRIGKYLLRFIHPLVFEKILVSIVLIGALRLLFFS